MSIDPRRAEFGFDGGAERPTSWLPVGVATVRTVDTSFIKQVVQGIVLALGLALAGGNAFALWHSRRAWRRYEADLDAWRKAGRKKSRGGSGGDSRGAKPEAPEQQVRTSAAITNIVIGVAIALVAIASLTFKWVS